MVEESADEEEPETLDEDATAFRYVIPLEEEDGVLKPVYDINYQGHVLEKRYRSDDYVLVQTEGLGYLHQESVAATYEEVPVSDYTDPTELEKDVDYKNHV